VIGRVASWNAARRFGFLRAGGRRYFVHVADVKDGGTLAHGDFVHFTPTESERGRRALQVRRASSACAKCGETLHGADCGACGFTIEAADAGTMLQTQREAS
jgi:cold shock CspA family protein